MFDYLDKISFNRTVFALFLFINPYYDSENDKYLTIQGLNLPKLSNEDNFVTNLSLFSLFFENGVIEEIIFYNSRDDRLNNKHIFSFNQYDLSELKNEIEQDYFGFRDYFSSSFKIKGIEITEYLQEEGEFSVIFNENKINTIFEDMMKVWLKSDYYNTPNGNMISIKNQVLFVIKYILELLNKFSSNSNEFTLNISDLLNPKTSERIDDEGFFYELISFDRNSSLKPILVLRLLHKNELIILNNFTFGLGNDELFPIKIEITEDFVDRFLDEVKIENNILKLLKTEGYESPNSIYDLNNNNKTFICQNFEFEINNNSQLLYIKHVQDKKHYDTLDLKSSYFGMILKYCIDKGIQGKIEIEVVFKNLKIRKQKYEILATFKNSQSKALNKLEKSLKIKRKDFNSVIKLSRGYIYFDYQ